MQCINLKKASLDQQGSITFSMKQAIPGLVPFLIPCRKCLPCRLNQAREKAVRAFHEAQMHKDNIFLTLTYSDDHLESSRLIYEHWQTFFRALRDHLRPQTISAMVTGEYGEKNKRPHWHAIIFNYTPDDPQKKYITDLDEQVYTSQFLTELWGKGAVEYGSVTMDSASYVARYSAKKLVHGEDDEHDYNPIHNTPKKYPLGKSWITKYWRHTFENGFIVLPNGKPTKIPRYYEDWLKKQMPEQYLRYVTQVKLFIEKKAEAKARKEELEFFSTLLTLSDIRARGIRVAYPLTRSKIKETILQSKFKQLQERLKL